MQRKLMALRLSRRGIYVGTIVAIFAMVGGLALAAGLFGPFTSTNVNGNQGVVTTSGTIYASGISGSDFNAAAGGVGGTCTAPSQVGSGPTEIVTGWVQGGTGACTTTPDYFLQLTFTSGPAALTSSKTYTDDFVISSEFGGATSYTSSSVSIACVLGATQTVCQAVIDIDTGIAATNAQPSVDAVDITVTGS